MRGNLPVPMSSASVVAEIGRINQLRRSGEGGRSLESELSLPQARGVRGRHLEARRFGGPAVSRIRNQSVCQGLCVNPETAMSRIVREAKPPLPTF
jgi:hypothetical protein